MKSRPRKGAWIEMARVYVSEAASTCRPRKGAWIEMASWGSTISGGIVAPARGRGLKFTDMVRDYQVDRSPPQGGVD